MPKLSQIADAPSAPATTDKLIGVAGGATDYGYTLSQVATTVSSLLPAAANAISYDTRAAAVAATIPAAFNFVTTGGYALLGDGGGARYARTGSGGTAALAYPSYGFTDAAGKNFAYIPEPDGWNAKVAGVVADGTTKDADHLMNALLPFQNSTLVLGGGDVTGVLLLPGPFITASGVPQSGIIRLDKPVIIAGSNGAAIKIKGQNTSANGIVSSVLQWNPDTVPYTSSQSMLLLQGVNQSIIEDVGFDGGTYTANYLLTNLVHLLADNTTSGVTVSAPGVPVAGLNKTFTVSSTSTLLAGTSAVAIGVGTANYEIVYIKNVLPGGTQFIADCGNTHVAGENVGANIATNNITFRRCTFAGPARVPLSSCLTVGNGLALTVQAAQIILDSCELISGVLRTSVGTVTITSGSPAVINETAHGLTLGRPVKLEGPSGTLLGGPANFGLYSTPTYYVVPKDADHYWLTKDISGVYTNQNTTALTFSNGSPDLVVNAPGHTLAAGNPVVFQSDGIMPGVTGPGISGTFSLGGGGSPGGPTYWVTSTTSSTFKVSATAGGANVAYSGSVSGNTKIVGAGSVVTLVSASGTPPASVVRQIRGRSGFFTYGGGNVKNFFIFNTVFSNCEIGINGDPFSGSVEIFYCTFAANSVSDIQANGAINVHVVSCETESSGQRFFQGVSGSGSYMATLEQNSYQSGLPFDGIVIIWSSDLTLINNAFLNGARDSEIVGAQPTIRCGELANISNPSIAPVPFYGSISGTTLTVNTPASPAIGANYTVTGVGVSTGTRIVSGSGSSWTINNSQTVAARGMLATPPGPFTQSGITSIGNYFQYAGPDTPVFFDGSGNAYTTTGFPGVHTKWQVQQLNDYGDRWKFPASVGYFQSLTTAHDTFNADAAFINVSNGLMSDGCLTVTIPYTHIWQASSVVQINFVRLAPRTKVVSVIADVTQVFSGGTLTDVQMYIGSAVNYGGGGTPDILLPFSVKAATTQKGLKKSEMGTSLDGSFSSASGFCGFDGFTGTWAGNDQLYASFTAIGGNMQQLMQGSVTLYIVTRRFN